MIEAVLGSGSDPSHMNFLSWNRPRSQRSSGWHDALHVLCNMKITGSYLILLALISSSQAVVIEPGSQRPLSRPETAASMEEVRTPMSHGGVNGREINLMDLLWPQRAQQTQPSMAASNNLQDLERLIELRQQGQLWRKMVAPVRPAFGHIQQFGEPSRPKRRGSCLFHAGLAHNCDYRDVVGAVNEITHWGSANAPGKRRRKRSINLN
eukprot:maker-scaffold110_size354795-snap-gene-2.22 protein:Tk03432 transcript:maker-scaffold110_size354795-snap-gene-2.22-mRNA-1 annotation:"PREDICTED: uncharacterized protein LOC100906079"